MNTEWIYLALFGLMMAFCCYHMMQMMKGSDDSKRSEDAEPESLQTETNRSGIGRASAETTGETAPKTS